MRLEPIADTQGKRIVVNFRFPMGNVNHTDIITGIENQFSESFTFALAERNTPG